MDKEIITRISSQLVGNDRDFFQRVWQTPSEIYENRLRAIGFEGKASVLDAGFGFGQWLLPLARLNKNVIGIEFAAPRFGAVSELVSKSGFDNVKLLQGSIESIPLPDNSVDAIFCYSVILCTDYRKSLQEFFRILKPQGVLYFNTNGLGWYLHNLLHGHNDSQSFSSKQMAINAFTNTLNYYSRGIHQQGECIITPSQTITDDLAKIGFVDTISGGEGTLRISSSVSVKSFFKGEYEGNEGVIEFLCNKK